jgi:heme A synthase
MGNWVMVASSAAGLALSIFNFFWPGNGIHGSGGALLVIVTAALILAAALLMALDVSASRGLRIVVDLLLFLGIVGTGFAAYMLEVDLLVALMALALVGWVIHLFGGAGKPRRAADVRPGAAA